MMRECSARLLLVSGKNGGNMAFPPSGKTDDNALQRFVFSWENGRLRLESAKGKNSGAGRRASLAVTGNMALRPPCTAQNIRRSPRPRPSPGTKEKFSEGMI